MVTLIKTQIKFRIPVPFLMQNKFPKEKIEEIETILYYSLDQFISVSRDRGNIYEVRVKNMPIDEGALDTYKLVSDDPRLESLIV